MIQKAYKYIQNCIDRKRLQRDARCRGLTAGDNEEMQHVNGDTKQLHIIRCETDRKWCQRTTKTQNDKITTE